MKENITNNKLNAELEIRSQIFEKCNNIVPLGGCSVQDCLSCHNSDYKIIMSDGTVLKDFISNIDDVKPKDIERYTIEFLDDFTPTDDIVAYLNSETSNYKITRNNDNTVLKSSNSIEYNKPKVLIKKLILGLKRKYNFH